VDTEQRRKDSSSIAETVTRTPSAEGISLVAGRAAHLLPAGRADIQDTAYIGSA